MPITVDHTTQKTHCQRFSNKLDLQRVSFFSRKWTVLLFAFQILLTVVGEAVLADVQSIAGDSLGDDRHGT